MRLIVVSVSVDANLTALFLNSPMLQHQSSRARRKSLPSTADGGESGDKSDQLLLYSSICNNEDLGPYIRKVFASGKPDGLLHHLRHFVRSKESEIEEVCRDHFQEFIMAVDDLRSLLSDVDSLKSSVSVSNSRLQTATAPLISSLDSLVDARNISRNVSFALDSARICASLVELCARVNLHLSSRNFYMALRCVDRMEREFLDRNPSSTLRRMFEKHIPEVRDYVEKSLSQEFGDWLVEIRTVSRHLGQIAIGHASSARQREEELRIKQRQAEEQSRLSVRDCVYVLEEEEDEEYGFADTGDEGSMTSAGTSRFDLTPLYRAYHIHQTLGLESRFRKYYFENRKLQLTSDFQVSSMTPFLESHQTFFAQIAGFFIVEDRILRTSGGLISKFEVEVLWETAVVKMCSVLEDQFSRMQTANHLLLIKDYVSLFSVTLRRFGYSVDSLLDVLNKHRDKYQELLLSDCSKQIVEAVAGDKFEQMTMKKEYEYSMNVLSFQLQNSDIIPAFPYVAPFSSTVPDCCRIVRSFVEDYVSFMSNGGKLDFYDVVKKYLDRLLGEVLHSALLKLITTTVIGVSSAMQVTANMVVLERACEFFFRHAAQLSGVPLRIAERGKRHFPLKNARDAAEERLSSLLKAKVDEFMTLIENVVWMADESPPSGNEYVNEVIIYLETVVSTAQQVLPDQAQRRVLRDVLFHISENIVGVLVGDSVKKFNFNAITGIDTDIRLLESFIDNQASQFSDAEVSQMKVAMSEPRQLVNLLLSNHPENFLNPVIRERCYSALDYKKVAVVSEKLRDPTDRLFGSFGGRTFKQNPKKKSLDALIKRLKDVN